MIDDNLKVFKNFISENDIKQPIGLDGRIRVNYFVDLLSAVHTKSNLDNISNIFANYIEKVCNIDKIDGIVCPKLGNVLLSTHIANKLGKKSGIVRHSILFNNWIEGNYTSGDKVLLIDDVASDGELLSDAIDNLKKMGIYVKKVITLIHRPEGDAHIYLKKQDVEYDYLFELSDDNLKEIKYLST